MREIDRMIREALREEDAALYDRLAGEQSLLQEALAVYRGRTQWLAISSMAAMLAMIVVSVLVAVEFFRAAQTREMLIWGAGFMVCVSAGIGLKIYWWIQMSKQALMREIKRLELQVAYLAIRRNLLDEAGSPGS